jgi:AcrR family transcriptional regulator
LPRGRHGLPREAVAESQRTRIVEAMVEVVSVHGYSETRVIDVIGSAGVSRKTFYELFDSKEDCFLAAYDILVGQAVEEAEAGFALLPEASWAERVTAGLGALLSQLAADPEAARFALVEVLSAGPQALARRDEALRRLTAFVEKGRSESSFDLPGSTAQAIAGGITALVYDEIRNGAPSALPDRLPELVFLTVLPFLGAERAAEERSRARGV